MHRYADGARNTPRPQQPRFRRLGGGMATVSPTQTECVFAGSGFGVPNLHASGVAVTLAWLFHESDLPAAVHIVDAHLDVVCGERTAEFKPFAHHGRATHGPRRASIQGARNDRFLIYATGPLHLA